METALRRLRNCAVVCAAHITKDCRVCGSLFSSYKKPYKKQRHSRFLLMEHQQEGKSEAAVFLLIAEVKIQEILIL